MLTLSPSRGVDSAFSCLPKGFNNLLTNLRALDFLGNWNLMPSLVHTKEEFWPTRTLPTSAPPSSIIWLSGWRYSSPRCWCSSKKSMLTFSKYQQNDLEEQGRTDVGKVTLPTSAPPSSIIWLSGWRYSSPRCWCSSKKSMLTFSKYQQNDLEEEGRTDVGKVTLPTSAPPSSITWLSGWRYSSPRCLCSSKKSMLTFSKHLQNYLEEEGRTDVGKVLIGQNSPRRTLPTSAPPSSIIWLSGWRYSSPRCLCSSKKSMLTFSKHRTYKIT